MRHPKVRSKVNENLNLMAGIEGPLPQNRNEA